MQTSRCPDSAVTAGWKPSAPTRLVYSTNVPNAFGCGACVPHRREQVRLAHPEAAVQVDPGPLLGGAARRSARRSPPVLAGGAAIRALNAASPATAAAWVGSRGSGR